MKAKHILVTIVLLLLLAFIFTLSGCGATVETNTKAETSMFVQVESAGLWKVVYHKDTKVMYAVSAGSYNYGTFTVLLNPDGTPMIWDGD